MSKKRRTSRGKWDGSLRRAKKWTSFQPSKDGQSYTFAHVTGEARAERGYKEIRDPDVIAAMRAEFNGAAAVKIGSDRSAPAIAGKTENIGLRLRASKCTEHSRPEATCQKCQNAGKPSSAARQELRDVVRAAVKRGLRIVYTELTECWFKLVGQADDALNAALRTMRYLEEIVSSRLRYSRMSASRDNATPIERGAKAKLDTAKQETLDARREEGYGPAGWQRFQTGMPANHNDTLKRPDAMPRKSGRHESAIETRKTMKTVRKEIATPAIDVATANYLPDVPLNGIVEPDAILRSQVNASYANAITPMA